MADGGCAGSAGADDRGLGASAAEGRGGGEGELADAALAGDFEGDLAEMEAFVAEMPAAEGGDGGASLDPSAGGSSGSGSSSSSGGSRKRRRRQAAGAAAAAGIVKSTRGRKTSAEDWAKLSDKQKARRESNRASAQAAKRRKAEEIEALQVSNAATRQKIAELDRVLPTLAEEAARATARRAASTGEEAAEKEQALADALGE